MNLIQGLTPEEVSDAFRLSTEDDGDLDELKAPVISYIHAVQPQIDKYAGFGMQKLMANVGL